MSVEHQQLVGERDQHRDANAALPHVAVLLSAFNGASFITQQLDSIFAQHSVAVDLFLRDDGSADATVELVQAHPQAARIKLLGGDNKIDELRQGTIIARTIVQARALYSALGESLDPGDAALVSCFYNPRSTLRSRARYLTAHKPRATTRTRTLLLAFTYLLPHRQLKS